MSVYHGTNSRELKVCLDSLRAQTLTPSEIIIVKDGPVSRSVGECIGQYAKTLPIKFLSCPLNRGLGPALHDGLLMCGHELVARVDTDDFSVPTRFSVQFEFLESHPEISVVGSLMSETFQTDGLHYSVLRDVPIDPCEILVASKKYSFSLWQLSGLPIF